MTRLVCVGLLVLAGVGPLAAQVRRPRPTAELYRELVPVLIEALQDEDPEVRGNARDTLRFLGADAVPGLVEALKGKDKKTRLAAAKLLGEIGVPARAALPDLVAVFKKKDEDRDLRRTVSETIRQIVTTSAAGGRGPIEITIGTSGGGEKPKPKSKPIE